MASVSGQPLTQRVIDTNPISPGDKKRKTRLKSIVEKRYFKSGGSFILSMVGGREMPVGPDDGWDEKKPWLYHGFLDRFE